MKKKKQITIGGVPEHFNYPWVKCIEEKLFENPNTEVLWKDCYGGTGQMIADLKNDDIHLAVMLTEGCIAELENGSDFIILQKYIETPLIWGVFVNAFSHYHNLKDLEGKTAAISRYKSGSHLMTYVLAENFNWNPDLINFEVCKDLKGAFKSLRNLTSDYLLWESFTTRAFLEEENIKHIGDCPTPWPCFVIVAKKEFSKAYADEVSTILDTINKKTKGIKKNISLADEISTHYNLSKSQVNEWLAITEWSQNELNPTEYDSILKKIKNFGIIS